MGLIIVTILLAIAGIIFYNVPIIGTVLCLIGFGIGLKVTREKSVVFGIIVMFLNFVLTILSVFILLITFNVIQPVSINIGYNYGYTKVVNGMRMSNVTTDKSELQADVNSYINKMTLFNSNGTTREQAAEQLFMDSSGVRIYYSSTDVNTLKESFDDKKYERIKEIIALKDSGKDFYLIDFDKLIDTIKPIRQIEENKRQFWLMDKEGNVYLNIESAQEYLEAK
ncbi:MAG: hypothetical protein PHP54_03290 [Clostridia bacterium]|nr:hypothetical protein [Clostridia bacterium]